ncbi:PQQ-binding-like beta-propeller repeat protein [Haloterrigena sp. SYSU A121-1]|uniref:PQQ-binding-like beta-propeller repeat protein n=1 Tax=Haloterrigena gelatinilytica TaxID=2741724 RepID=A0A8J8GLJ6_9EURY|nr:PQQ-binding-like beta-propeller repeat protein [Haloterrigena gelatinilytica]NUB90017.1 PQQ-binding-like beta-propeller repeat protein [Haloterrigena gelatinilytica]
MIISRRRYLAMTGSTAALSAAGCTSLLDGETDDSGDQNADPDTDEDDETDADSDASSTGLAADDWPSFQRTPGNDGYTPSSAPTDDPAERWSTTLSGALEEQVAVVDGTVYAVTDDGTVHALEAASGDEIWTESLEGGRAQCPCIVDGLVVVSTETGELVALDAADGEREWTADLAGPVAGPTADAGTVYVGTSENPVAYAIDAASGVERWSVPLALDAVDYPAVSGEGVYVAAHSAWDGRLYALEPTDGSERWVHEADRMRSPAAVDDGVLARGYAVTILTPAGDPRQRTGFGTSYPAPPATTSTALFGGGSGGGFTALDRAEGVPDWHASFVGPISATAVTDDRAYLTTGRPELVALDLATGDRRWSRSLEGGIATGPTVADGAVFVGTNDGNLTAFE